MYRGDSNKIFSVPFQHIQHHPMAIFVIDEVSDSIPGSELCFWLCGGLGDGRGQGAGSHRPESGEWDKNATIFRTGEELFISPSVDPISISLPLVQTLEGGREQQLGIDVTHTVSFILI